MPEISTVSGHLFYWHSTHPTGAKMRYNIGVMRAVREFVLFLLHRPLHFPLIMMNRKVAVGMLRQGRIGSQVLDILNVIVDDIRDSICEAEGIANAPENEDEIRAKMILV